MFMSVDMANGREFVLGVFIKIYNFYFNNREQTTPQKLLNSNTFCYSSSW